MSIVLRIGYAVLAVNAFVVLAMLRALLFGRGGTTVCCLDCGDSIEPRRSAPWWALNLRMRWHRSHCRHDLMDRMLAAQAPATPTAPSGGAQS